MTKFSETEASQAFVATADSRKTDIRIMKAIVFFAANEAEAEEFWNGDFRGRVDYLSIWEHATKNGALDGREMMWGGAGNIGEIYGVGE